MVLTPIDTRDRFAPRQLSLMTLFPSLYAVKHLYHQLLHDTMSTSDNKETSTTSTASQKETVMIEELYKITLRITYNPNGTFSVDSVVFRSREDVNAGTAGKSGIPGDLFERITTHKSLEEQYQADTITLTPKVENGTSVFDKMPGSFQDRCHDRWKDEEPLALAKAEVSSLETFEIIQSNVGKNRAVEIEGSAVCEIQGEKLPQTAGAGQWL